MIRSFSPSLGGRFNQYHCAAGYSRSLHIFKSMPKDFYLKGLSSEEIKNL